MLLHTPKPERRTTSYRSLLDTRPFFIETRRRSRTAGVESRSAAGARDTERAVSAENVEVARKLYELFARRDIAAAFPDYAHPDFELRVPPFYPDAPEVFRGSKGVEDWIAMIDEAWAEWRFEPER